MEQVRFAVIAEVDKADEITVQVVHESLIRMLAVELVRAGDDGPVIHAWSVEPEDPGSIVNLPRKES